MDAFREAATAATARSEPRMAIEEAAILAVVGSMMLLAIKMVDDYLTGYFQY